MSPLRAPVESVEQFVVRAPSVQTKINAVKHWLTDTHPDSRALLFVEQGRQRVHRALADIMADQVSRIHSNKAQHTRLAAMSKFRQGDIRVLVSTDVSARGIDVPETKWLSISMCPECRTTTFTALAEQDTPTAVERHTLWWTPRKKSASSGFWTISLRQATGFGLASGIHGRDSAMEPRPWRAPLISSGKPRPTYKGASTRRRKRPRKIPEWRQKGVE